VLDGNARRALVGKHQDQWRASILAAARPLHLVVTWPLGTVQGHRLQDSPGTWVTAVGTCGGADALEGDLTHGPEATLRR